MEKQRQYPNEWNIKKLADITEVLLSNVDKKSKPNEKDVRLCNYMDVFNRNYIGNAIDFMKATATEKEIDKFHLFPGDVIITKDSETEEDIAQSSVVVEDLNNVLCGYHLAILRPKKGIVVGKFLMNSIMSAPVHRYFVSRVNGATRYGLSKPSICDAPIPLPPLPEQQKIAEILTTVDDKISSIEERIQQTEQLKKGLMEKLLTEGIGHTEFKDTDIGKMPASWKGLCIGDLVAFSGGSQPPRKTFIFEPRKGYIRLIQIRDYKSDKFRTYIPENMARKFCSKDDIMIGRYGPPIFQILRGIQGAYNVALIKAIPQDSIEKDYLWYFLNQQKLFYFIENLSQRSSGQTGVDLEKLKSYPLPLPPLIEQKKISGILSTVDDKLDVLQSKKATFETLKKGLMDQLLTGAMRVKV